MKNKLNVPQIRFKGFEEEWEEKELGEIVDVRSGRDYKHLTEGLIPVYGTGGYMLSVNEALSYDEDAIGIGRKGTIDKPYLLYAPFWTVDTLFYAVPKECNKLDFIYDIFQQIEWKKKDESTGVPSLSKTAINSIETYTTKSDEQTQIGDYFKKLDNLITQTQNKLDKLKKFKSACLQKMFPKNGATIPEIRFKGFEGEWEEKELGEIGNIITGSTPKTSDETNYNGNYLFVSPADIQSNRYIKTTITTLSLKGFNEGRTLREGAILFVSIGSTIGKVGQLKSSAISNQQINTLEPHDSSVDNFTFSLLENKSTVIKGLAATQAVPIINKTNFSKVEVCTPNKSEQLKIGDYFLKIDELIAKSHCQLTKLRNIKKACLDKMFVNTKDAL